MSRRMANKKVAFSIVIAFAIVGMFYTLFPITSETSYSSREYYYHLQLSHLLDKINLTPPVPSDPSDLYYESEFCTNFTWDSATVLFKSLPFRTYTLTPRTVPRKIFFMETSEKDFLSARQACAVESAARQNPNMQVIVFFTSPSLDLSNAEVLTLIEIPNIRFEYLDLNKYFNCSPLVTWYKKGEWKQSPYKITDLSDALRVVTLWRFGGIYLDLDVVVIKSLTELNNCAGKESKVAVAQGVLAFDRGHNFLKECLVEFNNTYRGSYWGWNGPLLFTRVLKRVCGNIESLDQVTRERCIGVDVLPPEAFYAVKWEEWEGFFDVTKTREAMDKFKDSYLIHVWNKFSVQTPVKIGSGQAYDVVAKKYCPSIYAKQNNTF